MMGLYGYESIKVYIANLKQFYVFIIVGLVLLVLDTAIFFLLSFSTISTPKINMMSKSCAALFGYFLHQKYTFNSQNSWYNLQQIVKYILYLVFMIVISTLLLQVFELVVLDFRGFPLVTLGVKVGVESICVIISFLISKIWVYK